MGEFIQNNSTTFWSILSILVGIAGLIIAFIVIPRRKFYYRTITNNLIINPDIDDIQLLYKSKVVENVTVSKIILSNMGNRVILHNKDIPSRNPIRFSIDKNYEILNISVIDYSSDDNNARIDPIPYKEKNCELLYYKLEFEYFEKREGCIIQIIHTAPNSNYIHVKGKVIEGNDLSANNYNPYPRKILLACAWIGIPFILFSSFSKYHIQHPTFVAVFILIYIMVQLLGIIYAEAIKKILPKNINFTNNYPSEKG